MRAVGHFCANSECMASIYDHPRTYDLEHSGSQPDIRFFQRLVETHRPARILEFACGNGRLTIPMAQTASAWDAVVIGVESSRAMLESARRAENASLVQWKEGDVTSGGTGEKYDFIFSGCASLSHLLTIDDQIAAWNHAFESLASGGRFVVAEVAPDYPTLAESMLSPSHSALRLDGDFEDEDQQLLRCRATHYRADTQRMNVRYFYDRFSKTKKAARFVDDYEAHVYFPNELRLLFRLTDSTSSRNGGITMEAR
jgi:SAM-dependent methyltransferase